MKRTIIYPVAVCLLAMVLVGCGPKPEEIADQLTQAINAKDPAGAAALFSEEAVITMVDGTSYKGSQEISGWLESMVSLNLAIEAGDVQVDGENLFSDVTMKSDYWAFVGAIPMAGTCEMTVKDGRVSKLSLALNAESEAKLHDSKAMGSDELTDTWKLSTHAGGVVPNAEDVWYLQFNQDGTARWAASTDALTLPVDDTHIGAWLNWSYDESLSLLTLQNNGPASAHYCQEDEVGIYMIKKEGADGLWLKAVQDPCIFRENSFNVYGYWRLNTP